MIVCVGLTPAVQRVMVFTRLEVGEVNRATRTLEGVAGKSINVVKVLQTLGEEPVAVGLVGGARGERIRLELDARGIAHVFLTVSVATRECVTVVDEAEGRQTELVEESSPVPASCYDAILDKAANRLISAKALVLSGTLPPGGPEDYYARWVKKGGQAGVMTTVDAQGPLLRRALEAKPGLVKPNRRELAATLGRALSHEAEIYSAMREMQERGAERVVVTAGSDPTLAWDGRSLWRIAPPRIRAVNAIGSGDSFTAGVVWRLARGDDLGEACRWGAAAGAANALQWMAGAVAWEDVERLQAEVHLERVPGA